MISLSFDCDFDERCILDISPHIMRNFQALILLNCRRGLTLSVMEYIEANCMALSTLKIVHFNNNASLLHVPTSIFADSFLKIIAKNCRSLKLWNMKIVLILLAV